MNVQSSQFAILQTKKMPVYSAYTLFLICNIYLNFKIEQITEIPVRCYEDKPLTI